MDRVQSTPSGATVARGLAAGLLSAALSACATLPHAPPFATVPYQQFSRAAAVAIALREWRLFGMPVDDANPAARPPPAPDAKPERLPGLWQRVGEYWWEGMDPGARESRWTGKHDAAGAVFPADQDGAYAWSAAFVSYVMRIAGAGPSFPYAPDHSTYIDVAKRMADGTAHGWALVAETPDRYAPLPGDLICMGRDWARKLTFQALPVANFPAHCDIVVATRPGLLSVVGGNVDDAVTMKHVPVDASGMIATAAGSLDPRYDWFVVLKILYPA
jgi:hypothetical protein